MGAKNAWRVMADMLDNGSIFSITIVSEGMHLR